MAVNGWLKIHRQMIEWEWFKDASMVQLFIFLLLKANRTPIQWHGITIQRGQLVTSIDSIFDAINLSPQTIRTCLKKLESTGEIAKSSTNKYSIVTICNYESYQASEEENEDELTSNQQATQQARNDKINNQTNKQTNKQENPVTDEISKTCCNDEVVTNKQINNQINNQENEKSTSNLTTIQEERIKKYNINPLYKSPLLFKEKKMPENFSAKKTAFSFDDLWNLYDKKRGDKTKLRKKWEELSEKTREEIFAYLPSYIAATPDKQFRKDLSTFLNNKSWLDEIIPHEQNKIENRGIKIANKGIKNYDNQKENGFFDTEETLNVPDWTDEDELNTL